MFTGIIEAVGKIVGVEHSTGVGTGAVKLAIDPGRDLFTSLKNGASVAVNGVCLTLTGSNRGIGQFDVVPETWRVTNLRELCTGSKVNLERSLRVGDSLDGHFVQGHVDGIGSVERIERDRGEHRLWIRPDPALLKYIVRKGSIAIDGVSLTVVDVAESRFSVALIPTTLDQTTLGERRAGDSVNLETDILARMVVSRMRDVVAGAQSEGGGVTWQKLRESGMLP